MQPEGNDESKWFCVRAQPKQDRVAAVSLSRLPDVEIFCPRIRYKKSSRKGAVAITEALFPGYLFARFSLINQHRHVRYAHGVSRIIHFGQRYAAIPDSVIDELRREMGPEELKELPNQLVEGAEVKIVEGAFSGLTAVVSRLMPAKERIKVLLEFLGRKIEAELPAGSVLTEFMHPLSGRKR